MKSVQEWVSLLGLTEHPEGGFYREVYRSSGSIAGDTLDGSGFTGSRNYATSIYFLLPSEHRSVFHRIKSDEVWYYHAGSSLSIYVLRNDKLDIMRLGPHPELGEHLQHVVPANCWFGSKPDQPHSYTLCSCNVAPGFDFHDFEIAERKLLLDAYPTFKKEIEMLTNQ